MTSALQNSPIAYFGGTFDPVHFGHLRLAEELVDQLQLTQVRLLPCHIPPHKQTPQVSAKVRSEMLTLATQDNPKLHVDPRELQRTSPSYTIETLQELRAENPTNPLIFAIGMDSFLSLHTWHQWQRLLDFCHLVVFSRPGYQFIIPEPLASLSTAITQSTAPLQETLHGNIWIYEHLILDISSSEIRENHKQGRSNRYLLPDSVNHYIGEAGLYR